MEKTERRKGDKKGALWIAMATLFVFVLSYAGLGATLGWYSIVPSVAPFFIAIFTGSMLVEWDSCQ